MAFEIECSSCGAKYMFTGPDVSEDMLEGEEHLCQKCWDEQVQLTNDIVSELIAEEKMHCITMVQCMFCKKNVDSATAHRYQGEYVGECCWDERLRTTE